MELIISDREYFYAERVLEAYARFLMEKLNEVIEELNKNEYEEIIELLKKVQSSNYLQAFLDSINGMCNSFISQLDEVDSFLY